MADPTTVKALEWIQRDVKRLTHTLVRVGERGDDGKVHATFGHLWDTVGDEFAALSATLATARKHGLVAYDAEHLLQTYSDHVDIVLLVEPPPDGDVDLVDDRRAGSLATPPPTLRDLAPHPCAVCSKPVYPVERVEANGILHAACFTCVTCGDPLTVSAYGFLDGNRWCLAHFRQSFLVGADYERGFAPAHDP